MKYSRSWSDFKGGQKNLIYQVNESLEKSEMIANHFGLFWIGLLCGFLMASIAFMFALAI